MKPGLSILICIYNGACLRLVRSLALQTVAIENLQWEIIVADDGSPDRAFQPENIRINNIPNCRYIARPTNTGRAAIRNFLASQAAFSRLLFIDGDMAVSKKDFIMSYLKSPGAVVYGGYRITGKADFLAQNLRYLYEKQALKHHSATLRNKHPYMDFHTSNFAIERNIMLNLPFDEAYNGYGYEDVAYGKALKAAGHPVKHIDNPVDFDQFESNEEYLEKIAQSLETLALHRQELQDYSRLLRLAMLLSRLNLTGCILKTCANRLPSWRKKLTEHPELRMFAYYKIVLLMQILKQTKS